MKQYTVNFYIKKNGREYLADVEVAAKNSVEACKKVKEWYSKKYGKNAFRPSTKPVAAESIEKHREMGLLEHYEMEEEQ